MTDHPAGSTPIPPLSAFLRPELPAAALVGLPGEVTVRLAASSGADPAAILSAFLTLLGNAAGPQPHARFGGAEHPARLFTVLVGDAATGRKGTAYGGVEDLFNAADPDWAEARVLYGLQSGEAMIDQVHDRAAGGDCRLMVVETEFGRLVEQMARSGTLSAQLRNAWDGRALQRTTVKTSRRASRPHISLLGMITPEELLRHHRRLSAAGGLESRILYVYAAPAADVSPFAEPADTAALATRVRQVLEASRETVMASTDPISRYLLTLRGIQPRLELPVDIDVTGGWAQVKAQVAAPDAMHSRAEAHVIRLAAAYALADMAPRSPSPTCRPRSRCGPTAPSPLMWCSGCRSPSCRRGSTRTVRRGSSGCCMMRGPAGCPATTSGRGLCTATSPRTRSPPRWTPSPAGA